MKRKPKSPKSRNVFNRSGTIYCGRVWMGENLAPILLVQVAEAAVSEMKL